MNDLDMLERAAMTSLGAAYEAVKDAPPGVADLALLRVAAAVVATAAKADPERLSRLSCKRVF